MDQLDFIRCLTELPEHCIDSTMQRTVERHFAEMGKYPNSAGYKDTQTSKAVAQSLNKSAIREVRQVILNTVGAGSTSEEIIDRLFKQSVMDYVGDEFHYAKRYHAHALYIKPRITELVKQGKLIDSGERRDGFSGNSMKVYKLCS